MEGAEKLLLAIYTRFLLRDFVGKVIPGGICIFGVSALMIGVQKTVRIIHKLSAFELSILAAIAWISAMILQSLGSRIGLFGYFSSEFKASTENVNRFLRGATEDEKAQYERFVAIKEATGNSSLALLFLLLLTIYSFLIDYIKQGKMPVQLHNLRESAALLVVWVVAIVFLQLMHREHVARQSDYVEMSLKPENFEL